MNRISESQMAELVALAALRSAYHVEGWTESIEFAMGSLTEHLIRTVPYEYIRAARYIGDHDYIGHGELFFHHSREELTKAINKN